jgi:hypothetical protein
MKTYSFSVEADYTNTGKDFIDSILNEIESEKRQLELTYRINRETTAMHRQILVDLVDEINTTLQHVGLKFDRIVADGNGMNQYRGHKAICTFPNEMSWVIVISAHNDHTFKDSKYCTYTGSYLLRSGSISIPNYTEGANYGMQFGRSFKTIDELLNSMRDSIKTHLLTRK